MDTKDPLPVALAALEICEALIFTLVEKGILSQADTIRLLENVASAKQAGYDEENSISHGKAASIVTEIICSVEAIRDR